MKRRDVLKYVAFATGSVISSPFLNAFLSKETAQFLTKDKNYKPSFFDDQEFMLLVHLANAILPKTDSPSASEVGVPGTIDSIIFNVYSKKDQQAFRKRFSSLEVHLKRKSFLKADQTKKVELLLEIESSTDQKLAAIKQSYFELKQQVIAYYLNSEEIGENYLNYLPVPGYYNGCITLESVNGKAWSL